jgi:diadenosine tetraphosphate (Ap4A) HIT family hydrolase
VLPKGALVPEHVLIVPLAHFSSLAVASQQTVDEIGKYITALKSLFKDKVRL